MNRLKGNNFWNIIINCFQQRLQVVYVTSSKDPLGYATVSNAMYHRGVITSIREDVTAWQQLGQCV